MMSFRGHNFFFFFCLNDDESSKSQLSERLERTVCYFNIPRIDKCLTFVFMHLPTNE